MAAFSSARDVFDEARSWKYRVLRASFGTTTGVIVQAMFAKVPRNGMAFGPTCDILLDGTVITNFRNFGKWTPDTKIGDVTSMRDNMRRLADHCKLNDADRLALFVELNKWVRKDHRALAEAERERNPNDATHAR